MAGTIWCLVLPVTEAVRGGCAEMQGLGSAGYSSGALVNGTLEMLQGNMEIFHRDARRETRIYDEVPAHLLCRERDWRLSICGPGGKMMWAWWCMAWG